MKERVRNLWISIALLLICVILLTAKNYKLTNLLEESVGLNEKLLGQLKAQIEITECAFKELSEEPDNCTLSDEERDLIERVVAAEARGDSPLGMMAVAQVIKNRGDLWGMSYTEVVNAKGQFAKPYQGEINIDVKGAVKLVFDQGNYVTNFPITHFHNGSVEPYWVKNKIYVGMFGAHYFYY